MNIHIFDISHIREEVAQYLGQQDFIYCTLVSKSWHHYFTTELWKHPNRNTKKNQIYYHRYLPTIIKYKDHIHTIQDIDWGRRVRSSLMRWVFPSLRTFKVGIDKTTECYLTDSILKFIEKSPMLQNLELNFMKYGNHVHGKIARIFRSHPKLSNLKLDCFLGAPPLQIQELIQACSRFDSLTLNFLSPLVFDQTLEENIKDLSIARERIVVMENTNLRELRIVFAEENERLAIAVPLLEKCPLLKKLQLHNYGGRSVNSIATILKKGKCPLLKDISVSGSIDMLAMEQFIYSVGTNDEESDKIDGSERNGGIVSFFQDTYAFVLTPKLIQRLSQTITQLNLGRCVTSVDNLAVIVQYLPNLKTFSTGLRVDGTSLASRVPNTQWVVRNMTVLKLTFCFRSIYKSVLDPVWKESAIDKYLTWIFSGIGRLDKLKVLELRNSRDLMSLLVEPHYLQMLSGLTQLRRIGFQCWIPALMSSAEADWMIDNWPRLIEINIAEYPGTYKTGGNMDRNLVDFVMTLKERRPWIQIIDKE